MAASVKTLFGSASALFSPTLSEDAMAHLLQLEPQGIFVRKGSKVTYSLPD